MADIEWVRYKSDLPEVTEADLDGLEADRGVKLPERYRALVKAHRGDIPRPAIADIGERKTPVNALFFVKKDFQGNGSSYNIWHYIEELDAELPQELGAKLIPFTSNSGHAIFVFDYRHGPEPEVALVDTEQDLEEQGEDAITKIADSFDEFLDGLHD
ncbi:SMI1/KNR4 family protein [Paracoccus alkanivorans]|uniref:SMI1/KNR4 family protein n=1 Tax=Paracoccus alkanivorans TaxID=2116655 RepID=A0A3M0M8R5_9RHOB|nr:SMI1/KNR4 family protein [Paracoccus alkanivorans]RMC33901.1 SMI1/KNR4 family protein [Paracoccus alkanivorans]